MLRCLTCCKSLENKELDPQNSLAEQETVWIFVVVNEKALRDRIIKNVSSGRSDGPALTPAEQKPFVSSSNKTDSFTAHQLAL